MLKIRSLPLHRPADAIELLEASRIMRITPSRLSNPIRIPYRKYAYSQGAQEKIEKICKLV